MKRFMMRPLFAEKPGHKMKKDKADKMAAVIIGAGAILAALPLLGVAPEKQQGMIFGGLVCLVFGLLIRQLGSK